MDLVGHRGTELVKYSTYSVFTKFNYTYNISYIKKIHFGLQASENKMACHSIIKNSKYSQTNKIYTAQLECNPTTWNPFSTKSIKTWTKTGNITIKKYEKYLEKGNKENLQQRKNGKSFCSARSYRLSYPVHDSLWTGKLSQSILSFL